MSSASNTSPWLHQLDLERDIEKLEHDAETDVVIVGAGIAGVATAFFTLKDTDKNVILVERFRLAHGATGHNAGIVISDFERPIQEIEKEFGLLATANALKAFDDAWLLMEEMYQTAQLTIPFSRFTFMNGLVTEGQVKSWLLGQDVRRRAGLPFMPVCIAKKIVSEECVHAFDPSLYAWSEHVDILNNLETTNGAYIASVGHPGGTINSALFCQEIVSYLQKTYPSRFRLVEETKVSKIVFGTLGGALLDNGKATIRAKKVVLCTNGFEDFTIIASNGLEVDKKFHKNVRGIVSYMSAYLTPLAAPPTGIAYYKEGQFGGIEDSYFYLSRRPYEYEKNIGIRHNLLSIGGPQLLLEDHMAYSFQDGYPDKHALEIATFLKETFENAPKEEDRVFWWHGLMGYTPGMIRVIGEDPKENDLFYNLGCNGIGILPSIFGGKRIAAMLAGEKVEPLIFDPK